MREKLNKKNNVLILTQKVDEDDPVLGFFHAWICEFAKYFEKVTVICLEKGDYHVPENVRVFSLGKESQGSNVKGQTLRRITYSIRFLRYIVRMRYDYDAVFVHMNPEYVVLGGLAWRFLRKRVGLWYVHRQVNVKLWIAEKFTHIVFSTSPEAFRLKSNNVNFVGHGVDFSRFPPKPVSAFHDPIQILHVGRITPIKNLDILVEAANILKNTWNKKFKIVLAGAPRTEGDKKYAEKLKDSIARRNLGDAIFFKGNVLFTEIVSLYHQADISVNLTPTGGMDKAVLESIASGTVALSANKAFESLFGTYTGYLLYNERDANDVAKKIISINEMSDAERLSIQKYLYERVRKDFDVENLIKRIVFLLKGA